MAYRFKHGEPVPEGVRRIAGEELEAAVTQLRHARGKALDEAIHESRKNVKKVRALLRLVRTDLGKTYAAENRVLGQVGRTLSEIRDASSVIEIVDKLREKYPQQLRASAFHSVRRTLLGKKRLLEKRRNMTAAMRETLTLLNDLSKRVEKWPLTTQGFPALERGLESAFRQSRARFRLAQKQGRPESYHDWRKRVKDHWYHIRLLEGVWTELMHGYEASLKDVESWLGDDHNLELLREKLTVAPEAFGTDQAVHSILGLIDKYRKELRDNAESYGARMYQEKPRRLIRRLRQLWDEWEAEPKSLEKFEKTARKKNLAA